MRIAEQYRRQPECAQGAHVHAKRTGHQAGLLGTKHAGGAAAESPGASFPAKTRDVWRSTRDIPRPEESHFTHNRAFENREEKPAWQRRRGLPW